MGTMSIHSFNQLFRGWNYMYTDFLMTCKFGILQEFAAVFSFYRMNTEFLCNYLRHLDKNFDQVEMSLFSSSESSTTSKKWRTGRFSKLSSSLIMKYSTLLSLLAETMQGCKGFLKTMENLLRKCSLTIHQRRPKPSFKSKSSESFWYTRVCKLSSPLLKRCYQQMN